MCEEEVAEKMDECDSGGRGSDKGLGAEDEGSTAPLPERVSYIYLIWTFSGNLVVYLCFLYVIILFLLL